MKKYIFALGLLFLIIYLGETNKTEHFTKIYSRKNKCFSCEKDIEKGLPEYMAFTSKCFSCDKELYLNNMYS